MEGDGVLGAGCLERRRVVFARAGGPAYDRRRARRSRRRPRRPLLRPPPAGHALIATTPSPSAPTPWEATASLAQAASDPRGSAPSPAQQARPTQQATGARSRRRRGGRSFGLRQPATRSIVTMRRLRHDADVRRAEGVSGGAAKPERLRSRERGQPETAARAWAAERGRRTIAAVRSGKSCRRRFRGGGCQPASSSRRKLWRAATDVGRRLGTVQTGSSALLPAAAAPAPSSPRASPATPRRRRERDRRRSLAGRVEDVSMTMRLSGESFRRSSRGELSDDRRTEGAREAIAQRLAASVSRSAPSSSSKRARQPMETRAKPRTRGAATPRPQSEQDLAGEGAALGAALAIRAPPSRAPRRAARKLQPPASADDARLGRDRRAAQRPLFGRPDGDGPSRRTRAFRHEHRRGGGSFGESPRRWRASPRRKPTARAHHIGCIRSTRVSTGRISARLPQCSIR